MVVAPPAGIEMVYGLSDEAFFEMIENCYNDEVTNRNVHPRCFFSKLKEQNPGREEDVDKARKRMRQNRQNESRRYKRNNGL
jgi:hypothetical protein